MFADSRQPILVVLVWRGGERFRRALESIGPSEKYFSRVVLSITSEPDSADVRVAHEYIAQRALTGESSKAEIICTRSEFPTMKHQAFWIDYLERTGARDDDWICWLAYDDQLRLAGLSAVTDEDLNWQLERGVTYFGPWAMRHEGPDELWQGVDSDTMESWTSLPLDGPARVSTWDWIQYQLCHPTYIQMSGSVVSLESHKRLVSRFPRKLGPMRIELATAASTNRNLVVEEFPTPISIIYGRSNSDRSNYAKVTRREDTHLILLLVKRLLLNPRELPKFAALTRSVGRNLLIRRRLKSSADESWVVRGYC